MKHEIKCPKCGEVFQVDESGYAAIMKQVRDKEFEKELKAQKTQFETEKENAVKLATVKTEQEFNTQLSKKDLKIAELEAKIILSKDKKAKLTPLEHGEVTIYQEAKMTLICKKIYHNDLSLDNIPEEERERHYKIEKPHRMYIGEVIEIINK